MAKFKNEKFNDKQLLEKEEIVTEANDKKIKHNYRSKRPQERNDRPKKGSKVGADYINTELPNTAAFMDNELNKEVIANVGFNLAGLTVDDYNLKNITTAGKLPVFGKQITTGNALDTAIGEKGFILQDIVNKMIFANAPIIGFNGINDVSEDFINLSNSLPFSVTKTIYHNMYGLPDMSVQQDKTFMDTIYAENLSDIRNTFADTLGTDFIVNKIQYTRKNSNTIEDALGYLKYLYDSTLCHVFTIFRHYFIWKSLLQYGEKVNTRRNDFRNKVYSVFFQSAEMVNAINNFESSLNKFNLPLKYYEEFFVEFNYNCKTTTGVDSPMEFTITDVKRPDFVNIYTINNTTVPLYPTTVWSKVWDAVDDLINIISPTTLETMMLDSASSATTLRTKIATRFNKLADVLNNFYDEIKAYLVAINRGVSSGVITEYTDARKVSSNVASVQRLTEIAGGRSENNSMIAALSYASSLIFTPLENGYLVYGQYFPELILKDFISSDGILLFNGEANQYVKLYDVTDDIIITFNNVKDTTTTNNTILIMKMSLINDNEWHLYFQHRTTTITDAAVTIKDINDKNVYLVADHPIVNILRNEICFNFTMNSRHGSVNVPNQIVTKTTKFGSLKYTVKTLSNMVSNFFKLYSTR